MDGRVGPWRRRAPARPTSSAARDGRARRARQGALPRAGHFLEHFSSPRSRNNSSRRPHHQLAHGNSPRALDERHRRRVTSLGTAHTTVRPCGGGGARCACSSGLRLRYGRRLHRLKSCATTTAAGRSASEDIVVRNSTITDGPAGWSWQRDFGRLRRLRRERQEGHPNPRAAPCASSRPRCARRPRTSYAQRRGGPGRRGVLTIDLLYATATVRTSLCAPRPVGNRDLIRPRVMWVGAFPRTIDDADRQLHLPRRGRPPRVVLNHVGSISFEALHGRERGAFSTRPAPRNDSTDELRNITAWTSLALAPDPGLPVCLAGPRLRPKRLSAADGVGHTLLFRGITPCPRRPPPARWSSSVAGPSTKVVYFRARSASSRVWVTLREDGCDLTERQPSCLDASRSHVPPRRR